MRVPVFVIAVVFLFVFHALGQKTVKPPAENATAEETHRWLATALAKYGSYKTRVSASEISNVSFDGCTLIYLQTRKSGSMSSATMGATRTVNTVKEDLSINLALVVPDSVTLSDHIYPELQTIELKLSSGQPSESDHRMIELVVKRDAGDAIKTTLTRVASSCSPKS